MHAEPSAHMLPERFFKNRIAFLKKPRCKELRTGNHETAKCKPLGIKQKTFFCAMFLDSRTPPISDQTSALPGRRLQSAPEDPEDPEDQEHTWARSNFEGGGSRFLLQGGG